MPYTQVRIVDIDTNKPVSAGSSGEIVVRGPNVTAGYWENEEATTAAFDDDGWFHSGDIGFLDEDGYLFVIDRLKDLIITGGENVYPAEVERVLADALGVRDVAVVGAPDPRWGEIVVIVAVPERVGALSLERLRAHAGDRIARYKLPRRLVVVDGHGERPGEWCK